MTAILQNVSCSVDLGLALGKDVNLLLGEHTNRCAEAEYAMYEVEQEEWVHGVALINPLIFKTANKFETASYQISLKRDSETTYRCDGRGNKN